VDLAGHADDVAFDSEAASQPEAFNREKIFHWRKWRSSNIAIFGRYCDVMES
jgi:hypothetical protein